METLGVVRFPDGWRLVSRGLRWGRFRDRAAAEAAAMRLAEIARAHGGQLELLSQEPWGEMTALQRTPELGAPTSSAPEGTVFPCN